MAAVLAVLIAFLIRQMMRGWLRRAQRQAQLIGTLPPLPDTVGPALIPATKGLYVGSTLAPSWNWTASRSATSASAPRPC